MGDDEEWLKLPAEEKVQHKVRYFGSFSSFFVQSLRIDKRNNVHYNMSEIMCKLKAVCFELYDTFSAMESSYFWLRTMHQNVPNLRRKEPRIFQIPGTRQEDGD